MVGTQTLNTAISWAARLDSGDVTALSELRLWPEVELCRTNDGAWLRGKQLSQELDLELRKVPGFKRFAVLAGNQLQEQGHLIPSGTLPAEGWESIAVALRVQLPPAALPGVVIDGVSLRLVPSGREQPATILWTSWEEWQPFVVHAAAVRLEKLAYAANSGGDVVVRGTPLPPLAGRRYVDHHGVAIPAGWEWFPAVDEEVVRRLFNVSDGGLVLFEPEDHCLEIGAEQWVRATRSSVRLFHGR